MKIDENTGLKICSRCKDPKHADDFGKNKNLSDGLTDYCKECASLYGKETYYRYQEKYVMEQRERNAASRVDHPERNLRSRCAERAKRKSIPCTITESDIQIPFKCPVCSRQLTLRERGSPPYQDDYPSVDRYDSSIGYVPGNVWVLCRDCNRRKQDMTGEDLVEFGQRVVKAWREQENL